MPNPFPECSSDLIVSHPENEDEDVNVEVLTYTEGQLTAFQYRFVVIVDKDSDWTPSELLGEIVAGILSGESEDESE